MRTILPPILNRRTLLSGCIAALCSLSLPGCMMVGWGDAAFKKTVTLSVAHSAGKAVDVDTENGAISVVRGTTSEVQITAKLKAVTQERLDATTVTASRDDAGTLVVRVAWPEKRRSNEGCSFEITLPDAVGVNLNSSNGELTVSGLAGPAVLKTSNGAIDATDHAGPITADTSNGAIVLKNVGAPVHASSSNGEVSLVMRLDAAGPVDLSSSNGAINLEFSPLFAGSLSASTSNGVVSLDLPDKGVYVKKLSKTSCLMSFGEPAPAAPKSSLETSNGSISVKARRPL